MRNMCPASGVWNLTLSLTELSMPCGSGFTGMMSRYCNADGEWESADRSQCGRHETLSLIPRADLLPFRRLLASDPSSHHCLYFLWSWVLW